MSHLKCFECDKAAGIHIDAINRQLHGAENQQHVSVADVTDLPPMFVKHHTQ